VTIPDVVYVIDSCKAREVSYDEKRNMTRLCDVLISKANCKQRRGRAGRVKPGLCYHLVTKTGFERMQDHRPPELTRLPLEELMLRILASSSSVNPQIQLDPFHLLNEALDPPPAKNIERAVTLLKQIGAMKTTGNLTALGYLLSSIPIDVKLGKMIIYACLFKCLDPILTIVSSLSLNKSPFLNSFEEAGASDNIKMKFKIGKRSAVL
jgi:ATP-dependent RNA helicase DHX29